MAAERTKLADVFALLDEDADGRISAKEVLRFCECFPDPVPPDQIDSMVGGAELDIDGFFMVAKRLEQRTGLTRKQMVAHFTEHCLRELFRLLDADGSGDISHHELRSMIDAMQLPLSSEDVRRIFAKFDTDGSGTIDAKEFCGLVGHLAPNMPLTIFVRDFHRVRQQRRQQMAQKLSTFSEAYGRLKVAPRKLRAPSPEPEQDQWPQLRKVPRQQQQQQQQQPDPARPQAPSTAQPAACRAAAAGGRRQQPPALRQPPDAGPGATPLASVAPTPLATPHAAPPRTPLPGGQPPARQPPRTPAQAPPRTPCPSPGGGGPPTAAPVSFCGSRRGSDALQAPQQLRTASRVTAVSAHQHQQQQLVPPSPAGDPIAGPDAAPPSAPAQGQRRHSAAPSSRSSAIVPHAAAQTAGGFVLGANVAAEAESSSSAASAAAAAPAAAPPAERICPECVRLREELQRARTLLGQRDRELKRRGDELKRAKRRAEEQSQRVAALERSMAEGAVEPAGALAAQLDAERAAAEQDRAALLGRLADLESGAGVEAQLQAAREAQSCAEQEIWALRSALDLRSAELERLRGSMQCVAAQCAAVQPELAAQLTHCMAEARQEAVAAELRAFGEGGAEAAIAEAVAARAESAAAAAAAAGAEAEEPGAGDDRAEAVEPQGSAAPAAAPAPPPSADAARTGHFRQAQRAPRPGRTPALPAAPAATVKYARMHAATGEVRVFYGGPLEEQAAAEEAAVLREELQRREQHIALLEARLDKARAAILVGVGEGSAGAAAAAAAAAARRGRDAILPLGPGAAGRSRSQEPLGRRGSATPCAPAAVCSGGASQRSASVSPGAGVWPDAASAPLYYGSGWGRSISGGSAQTGGDILPAQRPVPASPCGAFAALRRQPQPTAAPAHGNQSWIPTPAQLRGRLSPPRPRGDGSRLRSRTPTPPRSGPMDDL